MLEERGVTEKECPCWLWKGPPPSPSTTPPPFVPPPPSPCSTPPRSSFLPISPSPLSALSVCVPPGTLWFEELSLRIPRLVEEERVDETGSCSGAREVEVLEEVDISEGDNNEEEKEGKDSVLNTAEGDVRSGREGAETWGGEINGVTNEVTPDDETEWGAKSKWWIV